MKNMDTFYLDANISPIITLLVACSHESQLGLLQFCIKSIKVIIHLCDTIPLPAVVCYTLHISIFNITPTIHTYLYIGVSTKLLYNGPLLALMINTL